MPNITDENLHIQQATAHSQPRLVTGRARQLHTIGAGSTDGVLVDDRVIRARRIHVLGQGVSSTDRVAGSVSLSNSVIRSLKSSLLADIHGHTSDLVGGIGAGARATSVVAGQQISIVSTDNSEESNNKDKNVEQHLKHELGKTVC